VLFLTFIFQQPCENYYIIVDNTQNRLYSFGIDTHNGSFDDLILEIKNLVKLSEEDIIPRGSGTSFTGAVIPKNSIIVDFSNMDKIIEVNILKKTVTLEPGVLLSDLNEELEEKTIKME
jgi:hypothetical protein